MEKLRAGSEEAFLQQPSARETLNATTMVRTFQRRFMGDWAGKGNML
jgi:hypothetical protein